MTLCFRIGIHWPKWFEDMVSIIAIYLFVGHQIGWNKVHYEAKGLGLDKGKDKVMQCILYICRFKCILFFSETACIIVCVVLKTSLPSFWNILKKDRNCLFITLMCFNSYYYTAYNNTIHQMGSCKIRGSGCKSVVDEVSFRHSLHYKFINYIYLFCTIVL